MAEMDQQTKEYEETKRQIEEDCDTEITDIKAKYEKKLKEQMEANEAVTSEASNTKKRVDKMLSEAEQAKTNYENLKKEKENLLTKNANLGKEVESHKKEIQERDDTIQDKVSIELLIFISGIKKTDGVA